MDPNKPPPITTIPQKRKDRSPTPQQHQRSPHFSPGHAQVSPTSLPSIRQLHPFLPPPGTLHSPHASETSFQYPPHAAFSAPSGSNVRFAHVEPTLGPSDFSAPAMGDSEPEADAEPANRPKQKRRRQALSCTECKRRKIKCDRAHPCGPCSRRGDQEKCQWHVIEPIDKYVSRAEFDELKARFDRLEGIVARLPHSYAGPSTSAEGLPSMGAPSGMPGASSSSSAYHGEAAAPPPPFHQPMTRHPYREYVPVHGAPEQPRAGLSSMSAPPQPLPSSNRHESYPSGTPPESGGPSSSRLSAAVRSPPRGSAKPSPLSLSSITTPYNVTPQSKNCGAQTFIPLGERLRPRASPEGPAASSPRPLASRTQTHDTRPIRRRRATTISPLRARRRSALAALCNIHDGTAPGDRSRRRLNMAANRDQFAV